jgi:hypothetical protein
VGSRYGPAPSEWAVIAFAHCADPPPGLVRIEADSPETSVDKSITVLCPAGKVLLGTAAVVPGEQSYVMIEDIRPAAFLNAVTVHAAERVDVSHTWSITAYAICASI